MNYRKYFRYFLNVGKLEHFPELNQILTSFRKI